MKRMLVTDIVTSKGYVIKGGWVCEIPDFKADEAYRTKLISQILPELGYDRLKAEREADKRIDEMCREPFIHRMKEFVRRMADDYAKRFPARIKGKHLDGFDPHVIAQHYQPYRARTGRDGSPQLHKLLADMATMPVYKPERGLQAR